MNKVMQDHYRQLLGHRIVQLAESTDQPPIPGLLLDDGTAVWIQCDPEGNGPGFLLIEKPTETRPLPET